MQLWCQWWSLVAPLRAACARQRSFLWLVVALAGLCARADLLGVTSIVRTLGLAARCYDRLLDFFHGPAVEVDGLTRHWVQRVLQLLPLHRFAGRPVLLGDGIKVAKAGRRMPAVKLLYQPGESNTKPAYIMGHSVQVVSVLISAADSYFAVPLAGRIHEGVKFTNRDHRTLPGKCCDLLDTLGLGEPFYFVADAFYGCKTVAQRLRGSDSHLISRVRRTAVAYLPAPTPSGRRKRGRPRLYGQRVKLWSLFDCEQQPWQQADSPVYGERGVTIRYLPRDLLWRPLRTVARFVLVDHPTRGRSIFITTDLNLEPIEAIRLYGLRFKIELSFKQALRVLGTYSYHFWMASMRKIKRGSGTQHLHRAGDQYRAAVRRKLS
ncbi:MAG: transposase, partial [Longimicrobiales bacterium]